jgi:hypothetical protein
MSMKTPLVTLVAAPTLETLASTVTEKEAGLVGVANLRTISAVEASNGPPVPGTTHGVPGLTVIAVTLTRVPLRSARSSLTGLESRLWVDVSYVTSRSPVR